MRIVSFLTLLAVVFSCNFNRIGRNVSDIEKNGIYPSDSTKYKIVKIDSIKNVYVIYALKNRTYYKLLSHKDSSKTECEKLKINEEYSLELKSLLFPTDSGFLRSGHISGMDFSGVPIDIEEDSIMDLHGSNNIKGMCYIKFD